MAGTLSKREMGGDEAAGASWGLGSHSEESGFYPTVVLSHLEHGNKAI